MLISEPILYGKKGHFDYINVQLDYHVVADSRKVQWDYQAVLGERLLVKV